MTTSGQRDRPSVHRVWTVAVASVIAAAFAGCRGAPPKLSDDDLPPKIGALALYGDAAASERIYAGSSGHASFGRELAEFAREGAAEAIAESESPQPHPKAARIEGGVPVVVVLGPGDDAPEGYTATVSQLLAEGRAFIDGLDDESLALLLSASPDDEGNAEDDAERNSDDGEGEGDIEVDEADGEPEDDEIPPEVVRRVLEEIFTEQTLGAIMPLFLTREQAQQLFPELRDPRWVLVTPTPKRAWPGLLLLIDGMVDAVFEESDMSGISAGMTRGLIKLAVRAGRGSVEDAYLSALQEGAVLAELRAQGIDPESVGKYDPFSGFVEAAGKEDGELILDAPLAETD